MSKPKSMPKPKPKPKSMSKPMSKPNLSPLPSRQIHLDFHTSALIPDVGKDFDGDAFGRILADACVNSITLFAKCHHGMLYHDTKHPARHPTLRKGFDLLGAQIDACQKHGIRTPIYLSVMCDEFAADLHPDWVAVNPDGTRVGRKPLADDPFSWQIMDMSSPYADYLAEQIEEVVKKYRPVDGIFLDMCWDQPSVSKWARAGMGRNSLDPTIEADRNTYARLVVHGYMKRYNDLLKKHNGSAPRVFYNSRPKVQLVEEAKFLQHVEIEALPTGGWGYTYFPLNVRFARNFGLPFIGMTARFHKSWSDFGGLKPEAALKYECAQMLAHGGGCSVGDQLHPRGTLDREALKLVGRVYKHVEACEPFCSEARPLTDIAVFRDVAGTYTITPGDAIEGVVRLLQQTFHQFDFVHRDSSLDGYRVIILTESHPLDADIESKLLAASARGAKILVSGLANCAKLSPRLRKVVGLARSAEPAFKTVFLRYDPKLVPDAEQTELVLYEPTHRLTPARNAAGMAKIVEPYFDRAYNHFSGHKQTPPATATGFAPAVVAATGAVLGFDLFRQYATHGNTHLRKLLAGVLRQLMPAPIVRAQAPVHAEISVTQQGPRTIVHVISYVPQRRTPELDLVEEPTPIDATIHVRLNRKPGSVTIEPGATIIDFAYADGYATVRLNSARGHDLIVFD